MDVGWQHGITRELVRDVNSQTSPRPTTSVGWHPEMCVNEFLQVTLMHTKV